MKRKASTAQNLAAIARRAQHEAYVAAMREGRVLKAQTYTDRKRKASKGACRKGNW